MARYIYELADWPNFGWDQKKLAAPLAALSYLLKRRRIESRSCGERLSQR